MHENQFILRCQLMLAIAGAMEAVEMMGHRAHIFRLPDSDIEHAAIHIGSLCMIDNANDSIEANNFRLMMFLDRVIDQYGRCMRGAQ